LVISIEYDDRPDGNRCESGRPAFSDPYPKAAVKSAAGNPLPVKGQEMMVNVSRRHGVPAIELGDNAEVDRETLLQQGQ
jgi:hypothetical protein